MALVVVACSHCGKEKEVKLSDLKRREHIFCNRECYFNWREKTGYQKGKRNWKYSGGKIIKKTCEFCGTEFSIYPSHPKHHKARFCSHTCYDAWRKEDLVKQTHIEVDCEICTKKTLIRKYRFVKDRKYTCSKKCEYILKSKVRVGSGNPNWHNGVSFEPYPLSFNHIFKERIRERDSRVCQLCGMPEEENGKLLSVHHIDYNKENLDPFNHISLCEKDHLRTNANRKFWESYLRNLVIERDRISFAFYFSDQG